ncbi:MAG: ADP-ribosylglycohydrolase [Flavobacteriales bacterium]|jgi:ADP-ribosylglycohydrolase
MAVGVNPELGSRGQGRPEQDLARNWSTAAGLCRIAAHTLSHMNAFMDRHHRTLLCLDGLSVGDAFGELFLTQSAAELLVRRGTPAGPWNWTDDTHMALSVVAELFDTLDIDPDGLVKRLCRRFEEEPGRGYGQGAKTLMTSYANGGDWRIEASGLFNGGSWGNGAAMRAAPIGAFFFSHPARAADEARMSAAVTHAHSDGQAGAIAVAVATTLICGPRPLRGTALLDEVTRYTPRGRLRTGLEQACTISARELKTASGILGSGHDCAAFDTVPFAIWLVAHHGHDLAECLWLVGGAGGDTNTVGAIVGGMLGAAGLKAPDAWRNAREPLPEEFRTE